MIIEGKGNQGWVKFYIGVDKYDIYKIETSRLNAVYIYKKNKDDKLYLSYHNRIWKTTKEISKHKQTLLKLPSPKMNVAYRHEVYVLGIETDSKKIKLKSFGGYGIDMGDINAPYHA